jgi:hypothetical protein
MNLFRTQAPKDAQRGLSQLQIEQMEAGSTTACTSRASTAARNNSTAPLLQPSAVSAPLQWSA